MADKNTSLRSKAKDVTQQNADATKLNDIKTIYSKAAKNMQRRNKFDRIEILAPSGTKERWKALASGAGKTMSEYIIEKVNRR
jgi:hypothetical protein